MTYSTKQVYLRGVLWAEETVEREGIEQAELIYDRCTWEDALNDFDKGAMDYFAHYKANTSLIIYRDGVKILYKSIS